MFSSESVTGGLSLHGMLLFSRKSFLFWFPFPKVANYDKCYSDGRHHVISTTPAIPKRCAHRTQIQYPLILMLDGWMTAFKRVSVPHRQLGANLIDTHKTKPSCSCGNCSHDSLSLSMNTTGFCKHYTFSMALLSWRVTQFLCIY